MQQDMYGIWGLPRSVPVDFPIVVIRRLIAVQPSCQVAFQKNCQVLKSRSQWSQAAGRPCRRLDNCRRPSTGSRTPTPSRRAPPTKIHNGGQLRPVQELRGQRRTPCEVFKPAKTSGNSRSEVLVLRIAGAVLVHTLARPRMASLLLHGLSQENIPTPCTCDFCSQT